MRVLTSIAARLRAEAKSAVPLLVLLLSMPFIALGMTYVHAQQIAPGEMPKWRFYVAFVPADGGSPFDAADIRYLPKHRGTYLLPKDRDTREWGNPPEGHATYTVLERSATEQLIEVHHHTGDYDFWSRYRATSDRVVPLYSRMMSVRDGAEAWAIAGLLAWLCWLLLRWDDRRRAAAR